MPEMHVSFRISGCFCLHSPRPPPVSVVSTQAVHSMASYEEEPDGEESYEDEGLTLGLKDLGFLHVCVKQYANRTTDVGTYIKYAQVFDGKTLMKVVVPPCMWIGVDIYNVPGSYCSHYRSKIPYEWVLLDSHGVECHLDVASRGAGIWPIYEEWESTAPERIWLDKTQPLQQWVMRDSGTKSTIVVMQVMLAK